MFPREIWKEVKWRQDYGRIIGCFITQINWQILEQTQGEGNQNWRFGSQRISLVRWKVNRERQSSSKRDWQISNRKRQILTRILAKHFQDRNFSFYPRTSMEPSNWLKNSFLWWHQTAELSSSVTKLAKNLSKWSRTKISKRDSEMKTWRKKNFSTSSKNTENLLKTTLTKTKDGPKISSVFPSYSSACMPVFWAEPKKWWTETSKFTHAAQAQSRATSTRKVRDLCKKESRPHYTWSAYQPRSTKKSKAGSSRTKTKCQSSKSNDVYTSDSLTILHYFT